MDKKKIIHLFKKRFKDIPKGSKFTIYNNPNQCCYLNLERVNPTHIGIIWGLRTRKLRKTKGSNFIKIAKVTFGNILLGFQDVFNRIGQVFTYVINNLDVAICCYYILLSLVFIAFIYNIPLIESIILNIKH